MGGIGRIVAVGMVFVVATIGWMILGGVTSHRSSEQNNNLRGEVENLWGSPQAQMAPALTFSWTSEREVTRTETTADGQQREIKETVTDTHEETPLLNASDIDVALHSDLRRKGLNWYSLYDVKLAGRFRYNHERAESGWLTVTFPLPDSSAGYDALVFSVNGESFARALDSQGNKLNARVAVSAGQSVEIVVGYGSRGIGQWTYVPTQGVSRLEDFTLKLHTDFASIDFPAGTMSPSARTQRPDGGWDLSWDFTSLVTGRGIGMVTPTHAQPGELATVLALSAPVSLFFFFLVIYVLATIRNIDLHPMNYFLIAGAFFAFHLLFAYSADHVSVETAFALASVVSVALVVSYLRLVVSATFALREAAAAQIVYLIGFSLAHFWEGFTGLTVTVLAILTLFLLMQLTGRIQWSQVLSRPAQVPAPR